MAPPAGMPAPAVSAVLGYANGTDVGVTLDRVDTREAAAALAFVVAQLLTVGSRTSGGNGLGVVRVPRTGLST